MAFPFVFGSPVRKIEDTPLQRLHRLADDATSFQITDRHSFRAFLGLSPADGVPDGQTIADFREVLVQGQAFERLFALFLGRVASSQNDTGE